MERLTSDVREMMMGIPNNKAEWTTTVTIPDDVPGLYVLVSVETRQSKYFVSHVIDIMNK
jgi:hypothetical protein